MPEAPPNNHLDPTGKGWTGFGDDSEPGEQNDGPKPSSAVRNVDAKPGHIVGEVRGLQSRSETELDRPRIVWTFRLERYDASGNRLRPVPVEIKGFEFYGSINEGDLVEVEGDATSGTLEVRELYDHTTGSPVTADDKKGNLLGCVAVLAVAVLIFVLIAIYLSNQFEQEIRQHQRLSDVRSAVERSFTTEPSTQEAQPFLVARPRWTPDGGDLAAAPLWRWDR
jgi:hypothetical protein